MKPTRFLKHNPPSIERFAIWPRAAWRRNRIHYMCSVRRKSLLAIKGYRQPWKKAR